MQDKSPIYYNREGLVTQSQTPTGKLAALRQKLTAHMREVLVRQLDARDIQCVSLDPTDPSFTLWWGSFTTGSLNPGTIAHAIESGLTDAEGVRLLEVSTMTSRDTTPVRYRVKLSFDLHMYE
jgi:hypothetical protein